MPQDNTELSFLSYIGLVTTYHCQAACPHCIVEAGPSRKEFVSHLKVNSWLQQIANYDNGRISAIALTGGEPFSDLDHLESISEKADSLGLFVTAVTNAHWATSERKASSVLKSLPAIRMLTFSTDVYHQLTIPIESVKNAFMAALKLGIKCTVAVSTGSSIDSETQKILDYLAGFVPQACINIARIFPVGRARRLNSILQYEKLPTPPPVACSMAHSPVIFPDGRVVACFGPIIKIAADHPLILGNLNDEPLSDILDRAEANPILHAIRVWGPHKLIEMIQDAGLEDLLPTSYVIDSVCCTCYELFSRHELVDYFNELNDNDIFCETVAYARVYYLQETRMVEMLSV